MGELNGSNDIRIGGFKELAILLAALVVAFIVLPLLAVSATCLGLYWIYLLMMELYVLIFGKELYVFALVCLFIVSFASVLTSY